MKLKTKKLPKSEMKRRLEQAYDNQDKLVDRLVDDYSLAESVVQLFESILEQAANKQITPIKAASWVAQWEKDFSSNELSGQEKIEKFMLGDINSKIAQLRKAMHKQISNTLFVNYAARLKFKGKESIKGYEERIDILNNDSMPWIKDEFKRMYRLTFMKTFFLKKKLMSFFDNSVTSGELLQWLDKWNSIKDQIEQSNIDSIGFSIDDLLAFELNDQSSKVIEDLSSEAISLAA